MSFAAQFGAVLEFLPSQYIIDSGNLANGTGCCIKLHRKTEQNGADPAEGPAGRTSLGPVRFSPCLRGSFTLLISKQIKKALINLLNQNYDRHRSSSILLTISSFTLLIYKQIKKVLQSKQKIYLKHVCHILKIKIKK